MRRRDRWVMLAAASAWSTAVTAPAVQVQDVVATEGGTLWVSPYREVHFIPTGGEAPDIVGRLPEGSSFLATDGLTAWSLAPRRGAPGLLIRLRGRGMDTVRLPPAAAGARGVAAHGGPWVYLRPSGRFNTESGAWEDVQVAGRPCLSVEAGVDGPGGAWLLARDDEASDAVVLLSPDGREARLRMRAGRGAALAAGEGLVAVSSCDEVVLVDPVTLAPLDVVQLGACMSRPAAVVLAAGTAWVGLLPVAGEPRLRRLDLGTGRVDEPQLPSLSPRHALCAGNGAWAWFKRMGEGRPAAPVGIDVATGESVRVDLQGPPGARWRAVGRGARTALAWATFPVWGPPAIVMMTMPGQ